MPGTMDAVARGAATVAAGVASVVFFVWPVSTWLLVRKLDQPRYRALMPLSDKKSWLHSGHTKEVRSYAPYVVAEVEIDDAPDMEVALSSGFRQVAEYIFGGNTKAGGEQQAEKIAMTSPVGMDVQPAQQQQQQQQSEKVAMTSPVGADLVGGNRYRVWFMAPSKYQSPDQLPRPNNDRVKLLQKPGATLAAITFSGASPREEKVAAKRKELEAACEAAGLSTHGDLKLWQYHPPFAPWWQRRNEVLLEVSGPPLEQAQAQAEAK